MKTPSNAKQRIAVIHRAKPEAGFLQVNRDDWRYAAKVLEKKYSALVVYLELANNADKFEDEFYPQTLVDEIGMTTKSWNNGFNTLIEEGFLKHFEGEPEWRFHFKTTPWEEEDTQVNINCTIKEFMKMTEEQQTAIYRQLVHIDEDKMTEQQKKIYDFYLEYVIED